MQDDKPPTLTTRCAEPGCDRPIEARRLCAKHYQRQRKEALRRQLRRGNEVVRAAADGRGYHLHQKLGGPAQAPPLPKDLMDRGAALLRETYARGWMDAMHFIACAVEKNVPITPPSIPIDARRKPRRTGMLEILREEATRAK